jgi:hypothetical protein
MKIRIVDHNKWNRAKSLALGWLSFASFIVAIGFGGGLEGTEEPPSYFGAFVFLFIAWFLFTIKISQHQHRRRMK